MRFRHPRCENISYIQTGNTGDTRPEALVCRAAVDTPYTLVTLGGPSS